jgi:hypothetical protein
MLVFLSGNVQLKISIAQYGINPYCSLEMSKRLSICISSPLKAIKTGC